VSGFEQYVSRLNPAQKEAVLCTEGPLLIIAGAGSGKTSVLCCRVANIINSRLAAPWQILAVTFTNKAAGELRERLSGLDVFHDKICAGEIWAGTFHSTCVKILRRGIEAVGYRKGFAVYDTDDSLRVIKDCLKKLNISEKAFAPKTLLYAISKAKERLIPPGSFETSVEGKRDFFLEKAKEVYSMYQSALKAANALDFDDLIMKTVELFESRPDILEKWHKQFRYIMIDEYQDTNHAQYRLVSLLAGKNGNLCVVGDEDQSIYRFRGATIENILSFEEEFNARVIKLEQNYRSTENILGAANGVIKNNSSRKGKTLYTQIGGGEKVRLVMLPDEQAEAMFIAKEIEKGKGNGLSFGGNAVLYRTNAQSRAVELALARMSIPCRIIGGVRFYERKEIKDVLAYMSVIDNPFDAVRFSRIVNVPARGIGDTTQIEIGRISESYGISPVEAMTRADEFPSLRAKAGVLQKTAVIFTELANCDLPGLVDEITERTGYLKMLEKEGDTGADRIENVKELKSALVTFREENPDAVLSDFLGQVALVSDTDSFESDDKVALMTIHSAKGLEFNRVFLIGAEEGLFPSYRSLADPMDLEEERRLAYVAITRAKKALVITAAKERLLYGATQRNKVSRFVQEIPGEFITVEQNHVKKVGAAASAAVTAKTGSKTISKTEPPPPENIVFADGDRVRHRVFGDGTVLGCEPMGNDTLLEIAFDRVGTKKIMARFARVERAEKA